MKKNKSAINIEDLSLLIYESVKSGKLVDDYHDFLKECRKLGISSYTLQVLVRKAQKSIKRNDDCCKIDYRLFSQNSIKRIDTKQEPTIEEPPIIIDKRKVWPYWLIIIILSSACSILAFSLYGLVEIKGQAYHKTSIIKQKLKNYDIVDYKFEDWSSTNTLDGSKSQKEYCFKVVASDTLLFDYEVSSEQGWDFLNVYLTKSSGMKETILHVSGIQKYHKKYIFKDCDQVSLVVEYAKDNSYSRNKDKAWVRNVALKHSEQSVLLVDIYNQISSLHHLLTP